MRSQQNHSAGGAEPCVYQENYRGRTRIPIHDGMRSISTCKLLDCVAPNGKLHGVEGGTTSLSGIGNAE